MSDTKQYQQFVEMCGEPYRKAVDEMLEPLEKDVAFAEKEWGSSEGRVALERVRKTLYLSYAALGLAGEAGEYAEKVKKLIRDDKGVLTPERGGAMRKELGDTEWYATENARLIGSNKDDVIWANEQKLKDRIERGTRHGDGDNR